MTLADDLTEIMEMLRQRSIAKAYQKLKRIRDEYAEKQEAEE